ncbi:carbon dioxide transporter [Gloeobacter morelensis MG652769]|uniref:Carbon dioxide transporter n=1 Tax=Gloeobacter morelensis MG652769 TaxID=2781736 RepID=A0ABY3PPS9_9CYAN|nr:carbon dioxide transporter [Gloeobacter morelensis MG652769]
MLSEFMGHSAGAPQAPGISPGRVFVGNAQKVVAPHAEHPEADSAVAQPLSSFSTAGAHKEVARRLEAAALLPGNRDNVLEVVGVLHSYSFVLDAYSRNLLFIAERQFLHAFPLFKYLNGEIHPRKLLAHWSQDRLNYEYAEYCAKTMYWHGIPKLHDYLQGSEFKTLAERAILARLRSNRAALFAHKLCPAFLEELVRRTCYYNVLGQFWRVMSRIFSTLAERYAHGEIRSIPDIVRHIAAGLGAAANLPLTYSVQFGDEEYELLPARAGLHWLADAAVPYAEIVFFRAAPPKGVFSYDASAGLPGELADFCFGVLYANPMTLGAAGVAPTLLIRDLRRHMGAPLQSHYEGFADDPAALLVAIGKSFQKAMFCVTNAAVLGLAGEEPNARRTHFDWWAARILTTRIAEWDPQP